MKRGGDLDYYLALCSCLKETTEQCVSLQKVAFEGFIDLTEQTNKTNKKTPQFMENLEENNGFFCTQDRYWLCLNTGKPD